MHTGTQKMVSQPQIRKIHVLLCQNGLMDEKKGIINNLTNGRTSSTKEITSGEAQQLISYLHTDDRVAEEKRKVVHSLIWDVACKMEFIYGDTQEDYEINKAKLNVFCRTRGSVKKNLTQMSLPELKRTFTQFKSMYKTYLERKEKGILPYGRKTDTTI